MAGIKKRLEFLIAKLFGKKCVSIDISADGRCTVVVYQYKGITYITNVEFS